MSDRPPLRVLLVGAGAVGQVYGLHLQRAGVRIAFFVKPAYAGEARQGFRIYPTRGPTVTLQADEILTEIAEVAAQRWDQVWLCMSSTALRGPWLAPLLAATGEASVVMLQPGLDDRELLLQHIDESRLITGMVGFMAWQAPLPGEKVDPPGLRYWFPPGAPSLFSGPGSATAVAVMRRGRCPARAVKNTNAVSALSTAVLLTTMASLELAGWKFSAWRSGPHGRAGAAAGAEALAIAAAYHHTHPGPMRLLTWWPLLSLASRIAPRVVPTNLEVYFRYHFTKVGDQTRAALVAWIEEGRRRVLPTKALEGLAAGLGT